MTEWGVFMSIDLYLIKKTALTAEDLRRALLGVKEDSGAVIQGLERYAGLEEYDPVLRAHLRMER
jgi:hypothetical protein